MHTSMCNGAYLGINFLGHYAAMSIDVGHWTSIPQNEIKINKVCFLYPFYSISLNTVLYSAVFFTLEGLKKVRDGDAI
jgi:hypothetical protein